MSPMAIRRWTRRCRRHAIGAVLLLAIGGLVALHHSDGMAGMHHDGMGTAMELCVGAFVAVGTAVAAVSFGLVSMGGWRPPRSLLPAGWLAVSAAPIPCARAGPPLLELLGVSRR